MNDTPVEFVVYGDPKPQGSKRHVGNGRMVESSPGLKDWRADVTHAAARAMDGRLPLDGPLLLTVAFAVKRPKSAPARVVHPITRPDLDKLLRGVCDALTAAGVWRDDSQAVSIITSKQFADTAPFLVPGVRVVVTPMESA